ncbi:hypothetical protein PR003_g27069 [Phytophthora rubi]|uniref:Uncharacterized protein n=1 Tax=Phytophthora rubi TaxID=129364 RepID=A0A6A4C468_9STRA|nr:hypothetical protein PR003_g27069 [Phytophthora rubi]
MRHRRASNTDRRLQMELTSENSHVQNNGSGSNASKRRQSNSTTTSRVRRPHDTNRNSKPSPTEVNRVIPNPTRMTGYVCQLTLGHRLSAMAARSLPRTGVTDGIPA